MTGRVLVADDDAILRAFIALGLREHGYVVREAATLPGTLAQIRDGGFQLLILDRKMPGGDSLSAVRDLRAAGVATPVLVLTAARSVEQRIEGLEAGADDYLTKPFAIGELVARVRALLRRPPERNSQVLRRGSIELRLDERRVFVGEHELNPTAHEWRLLALLAQHPGTAFTRAQIITETGISEDAGETAVDHLVSRLRHKLRAQGAPAVIRTVRGHGFAWASEVD